MLAGALSSVPEAASSQKFILVFLLSTFHQVPDVWEGGFMGEDSPGCQHGSPVHPLVPCLDSNPLMKEYPDKVSAIFYASFNRI